MLLLIVSGRKEGKALQWSDIPAIISSPGSRHARLECRKATRSERGE